MDMVGRRGEPSMLFMKLEKAPFFLPPSDLRFLVLVEVSASSLYRWRGLLVPPSERGGVIVSMVVRARAVKLADCRSLGDLNLGGSAVCACWGWGRGGL